MRIIDLILVILGIIGAANIGFGTLLAIEKLLKNGFKERWIYIYSIVATLGLLALVEILKRTL